MGWWLPYMFFTCIMVGWPFTKAAVYHEGIEHVLIEWNFDKEGDLEGWQPNPQLKDVRVEGGTLKFAASGPDPILELRPSIKIDTSPWQAIELRMLATKDGVAEFFWSNTTQTKYGGFSPGKETQFRISGEPTGEPYIAISSFTPEGTVLRAGKEATLTAVVTNKGGGPARDVSARLELPKGVRILDVEVRASNVANHPDGTASVTRLNYGDIAIWRWKVIADRPVVGNVRLDLKAANAEPTSSSLRLRFTSLLELPRMGYVPEPKPVKGRYEVGVYYFPGWKTASQWMPIMDFPERRPALGWYREGDPEVADWHIKWAVEHGITFFVYDWYWVKGRRQLEHALHDGYLKARYRHMIKFCLLWANHNPPNTSSLEDCISVTRFWIDHYFRRPEYLTIDGKPVVIIFSTHLLREDLGTAEDVRRAFDAMRDECIGAGLRGLYLVACVGDAAHAIMAAQEGYDAVTAYNWPSLGMQPGAKRASFESLIEAYRENWEDIATRSPVPLLLPISGGWDSRPWHGEGALVRFGRTPENFKRHLRDGKRLLESKRFKGKLLPMVLIEAWNEWGEGSYIEPHAEFGFGYLDAVREVFTDIPKEHVDIVPADVGLGPYDVPALPLHRTTWDFEKGDEGWAETMGIEDLKVLGGALCAFTTSNDPAFFGPPIRVKADRFTSLLLRMRLKRADGTVFKDVGQIFWRTTTLPESEARSVRFEVIGDGQWHEYRLPLSENIGWRGIITRIRLDPCAQPNVRVELDFVGLEE